MSATELETSYAIGSTCQGDSGGPSLYVSGGKEYVAGVTSYSDSECKVYAVAERVSSALAWIDGEVNKAPALSGCNLVPRGLHGRLARVSRGLRALQQRRRMRRAPRLS
ncbi:MAG: trypsin-like serine protease [Thermomicrobiales bacterium]